MIRHAGSQTSQRLYWFIIMASMTAVSNQLMACIIVEKANIRCIPICYLLLLTGNDFICKADCHIPIINLLRSLI